MQLIHVETIRLDATTKIHLSTLKKRTGISNWNVLCRWAFCLSLTDENPVRERSESGIGAVEMTWKTFAGEDDGVYELLLADRCRMEHGSVDKDAASKMLRQHISRGAARLVSNRELHSISCLAEMIQDETITRASLPGKLKSRR